MELLEPYSETRNKNHFRQQYFYEFLHIIVFKYVASKRLKYLHLLRTERFKNLRYENVSRYWRQQTMPHYWYTFYNSVTETRRQSSRERIVQSPFSKLVWIFVRKSEPWWSSSMNANVSLWSWLSIVSFPIVVAANKILSTNFKLLLLKGGQTFSGCMVLQHKPSGQKIPSFHENDGSLNRIADIYQCQWKLSACNHQAGVLSSVFHFLQWI